MATSGRPLRWARAIGLSLGLVFAVAGSQAQSRKSESTLIKEADQFVASKPDKLQPFLHTLYMEGEWNSVLNFNLLALAALEVGNHAMAERALDQAGARILRIYADDPNAAKARSLWSSEEVKDFKGEPYERAMTFFYRGLLYVQEGDLQNARASFLQADLQNAFGQTERYDSSFALALYLAAWASRCDGDTARAQDLMTQLRKTAVDPLYKQAGDLPPRHLTLIERGIGPEKVTLGDAKAILGFQPNPDIVGRVQVKYDREVPAPTVSGIGGNVDWLALTRGGRPIQGILDGKVAFRDTTGNIASVSGEIASQMYSALGQLGSDKLSVMKSMAGLGMGASVISAFSGMLSRSTRTEADTRYWGSLPKTWHVDGYEVDAPLRATSMDVSYAGKATRPVLVKLERHPSCSFAYFRELSALVPTHGGVGNPSPWPAEPKESDRVKPNDALRRLLVEQF